MPWNPTLTALRNRLAVLFATQEDARRVVEEAQLDPAYITFDNKAINNWHNILSQAELRNKVEAILAVALLQHHDDAELVNAYQAYMTASGRPANLPKAVTQAPQDRASSPSVTSMPPIKILFLAANPRDMDRLKLDEEVRAIDHALRLAAFRDQFELLQHWAVRYNDLQELLLRHQPDIVHFSGHGVESDEIVLLNDSGTSHPISTRALAGLFAVLKDNIRCVVLNACYSPTQAEAIAQHIEVVIGMSNAIADQASYNFAGAFYQGLAYGRTVQTAFDLGCIQIELAAPENQAQPKLFAHHGDPKQMTFVRASAMPPASRPERGGKYNINIQHAQGAVIGDHAQVTQHFSTQSTTGGGGKMPGEENGSGDTEDQVRALLAQHQRNLLQLQQKKAIYAAGEEPLSLLNQIAHEEQEIATLKSRLGAQDNAMTTDQGNSTASTALPRSPRLTAMKRQRLQTTLEDLERQWAAVDRELRSNTDPTARDRLQLRLTQLEDDMAKAEAEMEALK